MMKKVYIGSSSKFIEECEKVRILLENMGFVLTRKWWDHYVKDSPEYPKDMSDKDFYNDPSIKFICAVDFQAVTEADLVIIITLDEYKITGADIELGYALALGKPVIIYGKHKRSAMVSSCIHVEPDLTKLQRVLERNFGIIQLKHLLNTRYGKTGDNKATLNNFLAVIAQELSIRNKQDKVHLIQQLFEMIMDNIAEDSLINHLSETSATLIESDVK